MICFSHAEIFRGGIIKRKEDISVYIEDQEYIANLYVMKCFSVTMLVYLLAFILNILKQNNNQVVVDTTLQCTRRLGIDVCLEGVENEEVRQFVKQYNVERHQGYYYAKPLKADALAELLRQNPVFEPLYEV